MQDLPHIEMRAGVIHAAFHAPSFDTDGCGLPSGVTHVQAADAARAAYSDARIAYGRGYPMTAANLYRHAMALTGVYGLAAAREAYDKEAAR